MILIPKYSKICGFILSKECKLQDLIFLCKKNSIGYDSLYCDCDGFILSYKSKKYYLKFGSFIFPSKKEKCFIIIDKEDIPLFKEFYNIDKSHKRKNNMKKEEIKNDILAAREEAAKDKGSEVTAVYGDPVTKDENVKEEKKEEEGK
jgi:hypothetical protein